MHLAMHQSRLSGPPETPYNPIAHTEAQPKRWFPIMRGRIPTRECRVLYECRAFPLVSRLHDVRALQPPVHWPNLELDEPLGRNHRLS